MKTARTTTAAFALALSVFLAHGAAAQNDTRSASAPSPDNSATATTQPMNGTTYDTAKPSSAANDMASNRSLNATGKVVTKNADSVIVLTDAGDRITVYTDSSSTLPTSSWAIGDRVTVTYTTPVSGRNHADTIVIASPSLDTTTTTTTTTADNTNLDTSTSATTLPKTASNLPLTLLFGSFAGAAAVALHLARRNA